MGNPEHIHDAKQESALLSWIQQFAPYGVFTLDRSLQIKSWNRWMESHSSMTYETVKGRNLFDVYPELTERKLALPFQRALEGESSVLSTALHRYLIPLPSPLIKNSTELMRQTARISPLFSEGKNCGIIVAIEDVTQRENQADALMRQHRRDEALSWALVHLLKSDEPRKTVRQLFFKIAEHLDFDTFFLYLRDDKSSPIKFYTSGGVSDELLPDFHNYKLLADIDGKEAVFLDAVKNQNGTEYELLKRSNISSAIVIPLRVDEILLGSLCFASWSRDHIAADESELLTTIAQYLATAIDKENTGKELKKAEEANQWMGAIVKFSADAIISKDLNGVIKSCNQGAAFLFGYEISELIGKPMRILIPEDHQDEENEILARIRSGKRIENFETIRKRKDGSLIDVSLMISPVIDTQGQIIGASKIARDITERKNAAQKLEESFQREKIAREKAESASRTKDDFLAALSHELRTPLNPALLIASESADDHGLPEKVRMNFETIRKSIEFEATLIDDLLDLTRITAGKMLLNKSLVDVHEVLRDAIKTTQADQQEKKLHLDIKFDAQRSLVFGDAVRLQQVFWNIIKNAIKFTSEKGNITIETSIGSDGQLTIKFIDTGIGMNAQEIARVFTAFSQGDHAAVGSPHRFGGLGLGLAISKKLIGMHSGTISATSAGPNLGAEFTIYLPLVNEMKAGQSTNQSHGGQNENKTPEKSDSEMSVLLVEDHEVTRDVMAQLLRRRHYKVFTADSIAQARDIAATFKLDFLISDIGLPDGNGNDLMNEFRIKYGLKGIALTGYGMEEDVLRGKAAGFVTHLIKPVRVQSLENALLVLRTHGSNLSPEN